MKTQSGRFLIYWFLTFTTLALAVGAINVLVDPYHVFRMPLIKGFNANKGQGTGQVWLYKAYEANHVEAKTILLGSSRVEAGLDSYSSAWPADKQPVYNLGIAGASPYAQFRYLQHWMSNHTPETVVVGVDFEFFLDVLESQHGAAGNFEARLALNSDGTPNTSARRQHILDLAQFTLSYDSLSDSAATVVGNLEGDLSDTAGGNYPEKELIEERRKAGSLPFMEWYDVINVRRYHGGLNTFAMADLRAILDLCESRGTRAILYIHPMPADTLEVIDLLGNWPVFEEWKRELLRLASQYPHRDKGNKVILWDFSDYDAYSTEPVLPDHRVLQWFWESWHYRKALGDLIIERVFDASHVPFGTVLTEENIESHLGEIRARNREYRVNHKADFDRVRATYSAAMQVLTTPQMEARSPALAKRQ